MKGQLALMPVIFLVSGTALTVCGLAAMVAMGPAAPLATLVVLAVGLLDGITGLVWTAVVLFSRRAAEESGDGGAAGRGQAGAKVPGPESVNETERRLVLASGLLSVIFLGAVLAILLYLHVIVGCLKSWHIL